MRKIIRACLLGLLAIIYTTAGYAVNYPAGIKHILSQGKLVVAIYSKDIPPFIMHDPQGNLSGYDIDLASYLAKQLGAKIEFNQTAHSFDEIIELVNQNKVDMAMGLITVTLDRAKKVHFTQPYLYLQQALLYNRLVAAKNKISDPANQPEKLIGLKIGVVKSSSYIEFAKQSFPHATLVYYETPRDAMSDVRKGKLFAAFSFVVDIEQWLDLQSDAGLYTGISKLKNKYDPIAIATSWEYPDLASWLDLAFTLMKLEHEDESLKKHYFEQYTL
jgi:polar amino acid transport system substrate-binding protein